MPLIDMPVRELEQYMGRNPKPEDHQAYWEKALAEMKAVDPQLEMRPAAFQCPGVICEEMHFTGVRGAHLCEAYAAKECYRKDPGGFAFPRICKCHKGLAKPTVLRGGRMRGLCYGYTGTIR